MRSILTIALATFVSCVGLAQTTASDLNQYAAMSDKEVTVLWEKLMVMTSGDTEAEAMEHLRSHGIGDDGAKALKDFRAKAIAEVDSASGSLFQEVCVKQEELREIGGPEMLAQMIEQSRRRTADARRKLFAEANSLLSPVDQERLEHLYSSDHGPKVGLTDPDVAGRVRNGELTVERVIARPCELAKNKKGE